MNNLRIDTISKTLEIRKIRARRKRTDQSGLRYDTTTNTQRRCYQVTVNSTPHTSTLDQTLHAKRIHGYIERTRYKHSAKARWLFGASLHFTPPTKTVGY